MSSTQSTCAACNRTIDAAAKLCPYCGANPATGERLDTQALLQEVFRPREMTATDNVMEYARQRQGVFVAISLFVGFLIIVGIHQFVTRRNANVASDLPAVPLTELTDVTKKSDETTPRPMPALDFQYSGTPKRMRTYVVERGATTPPEVLAAQQAAAAAATPPAPGAQPQARPALPQPQARPAAQPPQQPRPAANR
ncbi:MAG TPA: hypothetical protein VFV49_01000 [Thermoanaerobaculia bacterium]|nr:hypothetical protein [Thermoanaerobaculia bacterium]